MSTPAELFISRKIGILRDEGYPEKQAIAIAYSMAREAGYYVPSKADPPKHKTRFRESSRSKKGHTMKEPKPKSGYGYHSERKTWKGTKDDNWDIVVIGASEIKQSEYVGHRRIDGTSVIVWKIPYGFIAQKMH